MTIAIRYSGARKQFGPEAGGEELPVIEYQLQVQFLMDGEVNNINNGRVHNGLILNGRSIYYYYLESQLKNSLLECVLYTTPNTSKNHNVSEASIMNICSAGHCLTSKYAGGGGRPAC